MRQVVLLGASNLTISFPLVLESLRSSSNGPLSVLAAHGHGRSYGMRSRVLARSLPGIIQCDLWDALKNRPGTVPPPEALLTDVGNDLLYGAKVSTIVGWVETCLERLAEHRTHVVLTLLPVASVERLSVWRYQMTRMLFFPRSGNTSLATMLDQVRDLNERLTQLGRRFNVHIVVPQDEWYGFDPIHIRRGRRMEAWRQIFAGWPSTTESSPMIKASWCRSFQLWKLRPAERHLAGRRQTTPQPVLQFGETTISLF